MLGHHGVDSSRIELDLGFGRGIGFYTQMIFELSVPTPVVRSRSAAAAATTAWPGFWARPATTAARASLSGWSDCTTSWPNEPVQLTVGQPAARGYLVTTGNPGEIQPATIDLATFLRERINVPVVVSDLEFSGRHRPGPRAGPGPRGHRRADDRALEPRGRRRPLGQGGRADRPDAHAAGRLPGRSLMSTPG